MYKLTRALYGAYVIVAERKDATATITETVPRQRSSSGNSIEIPMQRRSVRNVTTRDGGVISDTEFPHVGGKAKEGRRASTIRARGKHEHLIHHMQAFSDGRLEVIPSKRAKGTVLVRCKVEEVDVLGTFVVEVVIHGDGSSTRVFGHGSTRTTFS